MKAKNLVFFLYLILTASAISAQQQVFQIWPGIAPGSEKWKQKEVEFGNPGQVSVRNVVTPTLTVYKPEASSSNGTSVIIAPGGGFRFLSWQTEGTQVAEWLAKRGVTAFVLKYRTMNTGSTQEEFQKSLAELFREIGNATNPANKGKPEGDISHSEAMSEAAVFGLADGRQAIKVVRQRAAEWAIDTNKIGIMGFSAGGMVTLGTLLHNDYSSRPDFAAAIYTPWSGGAVPANAPPLFIVVAGDDGLTSGGSLQMYSAWKAAGRSAELHVYSKGGHGFGMQKKNLPVDTWIERFGDWLAGEKLMPQN
jgi:acetyl esterase/lipase